MPKDGTKNIAVIPARGGSKRIPRKNIRHFAGQPLITWAVQTCLTSGLFVDVVVSTDDGEIAEIARAAGARVPFTRPPELSDDHATTSAVMAHAVRELDCQERGIELACCVYPAAAMITAHDLLAARDLLIAHPDLQYAGAVVRYAHPIQRALLVAPDGRVSLEHPEQASTRTQDLPPRWHDAGQFYWGRCDAWRDGVPYFSSALGIELPSWRAVDIDDEADWLRAEAAFATQRGSS